MKVKRFSTLLFLAFSILLLVGCGSSGASSTQDSDIPKDVHKDFLYYIETSTTDHEGDLYIKHFGKEELEKVDGGVINNHFTYAKELNKVFYATEDFTLYEYEVGKEKVKLAENVNHFMIGNDDIPILYSTDNYDLYIIKSNGESEKVSSNVRQVELVDKDVYYVNENGRFMIYNIDDRTETEIASDVSQFKFLNDQLDLIFVNND